MPELKAPRHLFRSGKSCPFACAYCFAKMPSYKGRLGLALFESVPADSGAILYPACDSELALNASLLARLEDAISCSRGRLYVSMSSKAPLPERFVDRIGLLDSRLRSSGRGFFKVSVSFSTRTGINEVEPRTASYEARLRGLRLLKSRGIACSVNLKPLLPFVDPFEYYQIVDECRLLTDVFLLGGLYIDPASSFGQEMGRRFPNLVTARRVEWLPARPLWPYLVDQVQMDSISAYVRTRRAWAAQSDTEVIAHLIARSEQTALPAATAGS